MTWGEIATVVVSLVVGIPAIYWAREGVRESREQNRLSRLDLKNRGIEGSAVQTGAARMPRAPWRLYLPMVALGLLMVLTWVGVAIDYRVRFKSEDLRLAPFAQNSQFFRNLPTDESGTFTLTCFPFDSGSPSSCNIALRYQDALGTFWRPGEIKFDQRRSPDFTGISIVTKSKNPPKGVLILRQRFRSVGIETRWNIAEPSYRLGANDFAIWIGGKP
jgi:hypothetical protein